MTELGVALVFFLFLKDLTFYSWWPSDRDRNDRGLGGRHPSNP